MTLVLILPPLSTQRQTFQDDGDKELSYRAFNLKPLKFEGILAAWFEGWQCCLHIVMNCV